MTKLEQKFIKIVVINTDTDKLWVSFDVYMEQTPDISLSTSSPLPNNFYPIIRVFNRNQYILTGEIITSTDDVRNVIDKLEPQTLANNFLIKRLNT